MLGRKALLSLAVMAGGTLFLTGCGEDLKERIALLEEENSTLYGDIERLRSETDECRRQRELCESDLLGAQATNADLQGRLAQRPTQEPDMPGEWTSVPGGAMMAIEGAVLFDAGKIALKDSSKTVLNRVASEINGSFSGKEIYVFGHTDSDPIRKSGWKDNRELSAQRALSVVRHLQSQGVPANRIVACGWGEHRPVASNTTSQGKAGNRRVELVAVDPVLASR